MESKIKENVKCRNINSKYTSYRNIHIHGMESNLTHDNNNNKITEHIKRVATQNLLLSIAQRSEYELRVLYTHEICKAQYIFL